MVGEIEMCARCGKNPATESHSCPYNEEINGDFNTLCTCCGDCQAECALEI